MEQKVFSKLNIYDQLGYLLVGTITIVLGFANLFILGRYYQGFPNLSPTPLLISIIIAYFIGHVIQSIANLITSTPLINILLKEERENFTTSERRILTKAAKFFRLTRFKDNDVWRVCYTLALAKDITGHVELFNAFYSLYRGWFVVFLLETIFLAVFTFTRPLSAPNIFYFSTALLLTIIFRIRAERFYRYLRTKVLETFLVIERLKI